MLPAVFESESIPGSDIWKSTAVFERGRFYRVEAASGGGKSSLCSFIYGLRTDYLGNLRFDGSDTSGFTIEQWQEARRRHLAYLPQELGLFGELTVMENIELKNGLTGWKTKSQVEEMLEALGVASKRDALASRLSVGQRQRVALARALCQPFDFLLLDEPVSHLDETNNRLAAALVAEEASLQGAGIIATSVGNPLLLEDPFILKL